MCQNSKDVTVNALFDDYEGNIGDPEYFKSQNLLVATNTLLSEVHNKTVDRIPGNLYTFYSIDSVKVFDDSTMFPTEFHDKTLACQACLSMNCT